MANIIKVKMNWSGFQGAPGLSAFYFREFASADDQLAFAQDAVTKVQAFQAQIATIVPSGVTLQVANDVEMINDTNGQLVDVTTVDGGAGVSNNGHVGQSYAAAAGAVINWRTGSVHRGRRVRGRTFLVPIAGTEFEANGTLGGNAIAKLTAGATALLAAGAGSPDFGIWARPQRIKNSDGTTTQIDNGAWYVAQSHNVPDMSAVLRSRRD